MSASQELAKLVVRQSGILNDFFEQGSLYVARVHGHSGDDFPRAWACIVAVTAPLVHHGETAPLERPINVVRRARR